MMHGRKNTKERTYVTGVHFIVSLGTADLSGRKLGFAGTSLDC
jgi:hypothetical protein